MLDPKLDAILHSIYDAAASPEVWFSTLKAIAEDTDAAMTSIIEHNPRTGRDLVPYSFGLDDSYRVSYESYYCRRNIYLERGRSHIKLYRAVNHEAYCSNSELLASEYYNDFQRRIGLMQVTAGAVMANRDRVIIFSASRPPGREPFSSTELERVQFLLPHIGRSLRLSGRLQSNGSPPASPLVRHPSLTKTEARVAELLVAGHSVSEICDELSIRTTTARTHLRHLFEKTDTRRQSELVAALLRTPR
ncbi:MAG TPA: helix-turn-helix transcriptional regulator [Bryobacteraceae bacterium]|nr:helix-turn-helix transcriptional regulator [Bryobacteraceae bacterium]